MTAKIEPLRPELAESLGRFFETLVAHDDERFFHPHPLTRDEAARRAAHEGRDYYVVSVDAGNVVGYGMLRGWDEGYEVPSLGIAVSPELRGSGMARDVMRHLHDVAWERGVPRVRLTVARDNDRARRVFESFGYKFADTSEPVLVGFLDRPAIASTSASTPNR